MSLLGTLVKKYQVTTMFRLGCIIQLVLHNEIRAIYKDDYYNS